METIKVLAVGDVVGDPGRRALKEILPRLFGQNPAPKPEPAGPAPSVAPPWAV